MVPKLIVPKRHSDGRGWFVESYNRRRLADEGVGFEFVQDNHSYSADRGTIRGIHFQTPPHGQGKLVRCVAGAIWDVAVDLRAGSPTYGRWVSAELTAAGGEQLFVPVGFGHGFITLTDHVEVIYKVSDYYHSSSEAGVFWNDPDLAIDWPLNDQTPVLSAKDEQLPSLSDFTSPFAYHGQPLDRLEQTPKS